MSEQLYRRGDLNAFGMQVVNDGEYAYPLAAEHLDALIEAGALVPVEPDYEAASLVGNGHDYIKRVLDAAYGIGDTVG